MNVGWLTNWSIWITAAQILFSIHASGYLYEILGYDTRLSTQLKAVTNVLSTLSLNLDLGIFLISWTILHPYIWFAWPWNTPVDVFWQLNSLIKHTVPFISIMINVFILSDSVIYFTDSWVIMLLGPVFLLFNYLLYRKTGFVAYYMNWDDPMLAIFTII